MLVYYSFITFPHVSNLDPGKKAQLKVVQMTHGLHLKSIEAIKLRFVKKIGLLFCKDLEQHEGE